MHKTFHAIVALLFTIVGPLHLLRGILGWEVTIGGWILPVWVSIVAGVLIILLALNAWKLALKK